MKTWALIKDGLIVDVIVWDGEVDYTPPDGVYLAEFDIKSDGSPGIGWNYHNGVFSPPPA